MITPGKARRKMATTDMDTADKPALIVVTGMPGAGKTTLATALSIELGRPLLTKDAIQERLFDTLGSANRETSQALGRAAFALLLDIAARLLAAGTPTIVEANFTRGRAEGELQELPAHRLMQIVCTAPDDILRERWRRRTTTGERHPGHFDAEQESVLGKRLGTDCHAALDLAGPVLDVDTSAPVDVAALAKRIRTLLP
jgi:predicted kinase